MPDIALSAGAEKAGPSPEKMWHQFWMFALLHFVWNTNLFSLIFTWVTIRRRTWHIPFKERMASVSTGTFTLLNVSILLNHIHYLLCPCGTWKYQCLDICPRERWESLLLRTESQKDGQHFKEWRNSTAHDWQNVKRQSWRKKCITRNAKVIYEDMFLILCFGQVYSCQQKNPPLLLQ